MAVHSPVEVAALKGVDPRRAVSVIMAASVAAVLLLVVVIFGHGRASTVAPWVSWLPALNAVLNGTSAIFLLRGYLARRAQVARHARSMLIALAASGLFLVSYILYHSLHGDTKFGGHGPMRGLYFFILVTHVALSAVALPLIFLSFFFALSGRIRQHKKVVAYAFPSWLYVSVTGVLVFLLLRAYG